MRKIIFLGKTCQEMMEHAKKRYPMECCGVLLGDASGTELRIRQVVNVKNTCEKTISQKAFAISPLDFILIENMAEEQGLNLVAIYHSHPKAGAFPSKKDVEGMIPGYSYPIISICQDALFPGNQLTGWSMQIKSYQKLSFDGNVIEEKIICR